MTYLAHEYATFNGKPIELYYFEGEYNSYLYTSCEIDWVQYISEELGTVTFQSIPIKRGSMKVGTQDDDKLDLSVEMPVTADLPQDYAFNTTPPSLQLTIFRIHRDDDELITYWTGFVTAIKVAGDRATLQTPSRLSSALDGSVPSAWYQTPCNFTLYDADTCGVLRADHLVVTQAMVIDGRDIWIDDDGGNPDGYFLGGEILSTESGERRMIVYHVGQNIRVTYRFAELVVGAPIEVVAGCDHDWGGDCATKFNNQLRCGCYGKFTPPDNPFVSGIE
jgi:hypothetical protein